MRDANTTSIQKRLAVDAIMVLILVLLLGFAAWIVWVYYFRGPIDIETRGFVLTTELEEPIKPTQVEKYTLIHFHNLDKVVLEGIKTGSSCLQCHGDYPHSESQKTRTFFNAHSWFMACEVCHMTPKSVEKVVYRWLDNDTGNELVRLQGKAGNYGGSIVPIKLENDTAKRLDHTADKEFIEQYLQTKDDLGDDQQKEAMEKIHEALTKSPLYCDKCHTDNGVLDFSRLLYTQKAVRHLESIDMGSMVKTYKEFHLPDIFDPEN